MLFILKFLRYVKLTSFDISISFLETPNFYNEIAKIFKCVPKIIVSERSAYFKKDLNLKIKTLEKFHSFADVIVSNSYSQIKRMNHFFPKNLKKRIFIPNGYNSVLDLKKNISKEEKFLFIVLSNTNSYKNPLNLCKALANYKERFGTPKFEINWFGRISSLRKDVKIMQECLIILNKNSLNKVLKFHGVIKNVNKRIIESDALIHLSNFEGCPNGVCEAMLLKKPVILSDVCDHPMLVSNKNGFLVNQNSPKEIANTINRFVNLPKKKLIEMGERGSQLIKVNMNVDIVKKNWEELILKTINK